MSPTQQYKMIDYSWKVKAKGDESLIEELSYELNIKEVLANLLIQRGITTFDQAKRFFRPSLEHLYDPFMMKDMDLAVERVTRAIRNNERILIYGDYDVDGTTSVAMVYLFIKKIYENVGYYIPDRYDEGYGISEKGITYALENKYSLIITLDCGIKANKIIYQAKSKGIDFVICDHHQPGDEIPQAYAVLDPKQSACTYPFKDLSGCGVGYKLLQAFAIRNQMPVTEVEKYLDLVAVSIASDIVPLIDENRVLAYFGLKKLNANPSFGLQAIIKSSSIEDKEMAIDDIVFKIGPKINAAGRMESGSTAVELLIAETPAKASEMSKEIIIHNNSRKNIDRKITLEALQIISGNADLIDKKTTVLFNPDWHKGVVGIVASRMTDFYYRPTVILTESNGFVTGSARSVEGYDLYSAIEACSDLLENFGGHMYAAGLTLRPEKVRLFSDRFERIVSESITEEQLTPQIEVDGIIELSDITSKFYRILKQFQPFGPDNMAPVFLTKNVCDSGYGRVVGNTREHLKLDLVTDREPTQSYPAIAFNKAHLFDKIHMGNPFDICYTIEENCFMGKTTLQVHVKDIKVMSVVENLQSNKPEF